MKQETNGRQKKREKEANMLRARLQDPIKKTDLAMNLRVILSLVNKETNIVKSCP